MSESEFAQWIKEVEEFLGHELSIPEWAEYLYMYWGIAFSPEGARSAK